MEIKILKISDLKPYEKNAKLHPQKQIDQIAESIKRFGMNDPIGVWGEENLIIEGHGRVLACKQLGIDEVPCIRLDHLTKAQRKEYTLIHNKTNMNSGFDLNILDNELAEISEIDKLINMADFDFEILNIDENSFNDDFELPSGDKPSIVTMTFTLHQEQADLINHALEHIINNNLIVETFGNTNKNGNALYEVVKQWQMLKN